MNKRISFLIDGIIGVMIFSALTTVMTIFDGCSALHYAPGVHLSTTLPIYGTSVTVLNNTTYNLSIIVDGGTVVKTVKTKDNKGKKGKHDEVILICPGKTLRVDGHNYSNYGRQMSIAVTAYDEQGHYHGAARQNYAVSGYYSQSLTWIVSGYEVRR